jgi:hypothetical protein
MTNTFTCAKGHISTEPDYCSECGVKIAGVGELAAQLQGPYGSGLKCPDCNAPHELDVGDFCEICGYNFISGKSGQLAIAIQPVPPNNIPVSVPVTTTEWELIVAVDPSLRHPESPEPPTNQPPLTFSLKQPTTLIGRSNPARAIYPDIALDFDNAISQRHAVLEQQADGTFTLRDIGSSNGTQFQGEELKPMVEIPLQDGDEFTLGHWTKITIKQIKV